MKKNIDKNSIYDRRWNLRIVLFIFGLIGFGVSLFLTYEYSQDDPVPCGGLSIGSANSCQSVKESDYASMFGISIPVWGDIFFTMLLTFLFIYIIRLVDKNKEKLFNNLFLALTAFGALFETYLTIVEIFVIKAVCIWCLLTEIIVVAIFLVTLLEYLFSRNKNEN
jgi:uncharacterized membrane protein